MTYAIQRGLGDLPAGWATWPLPARILNIRVRAAGIRALANAMGTELRRVSPSFQPEDYNSVLGVMQGLARSAVQTSVPVQVAQNVALYAVAQMDRLAAAALVAADSVLTDKANINSFVKNADNIERLRLAAQALEMAEQIQSVLLRVFSVLRPQAGTSGFGDVEAAAYVMGVGLLFGALVPPALPLAALVALYQLCKDADGIVGAIAAALGKAVDRIVDGVQDVAGKMAAGAGRAIGDWLTYVLVAATVVGGLYYGVPYLLSKKAAGAVR